jgi:outer membrane protein OmpA-like peptidoglycan-associated protein
MNAHVKIAGALVLLGAVAALGYKFGLPLLQERTQLLSSDARDVKGRIAIGTDSWIGYFPLCSDEMARRMRAKGYVLRCVDDKADYAKRMAALKSGQLQFAVATVDAYLQAGRDQGFPGAIVAVLDESKGGDAIVAWKDRVASLDAIKAAGGRVSIAFTPNSPSEHLIRSAAVHFDISPLRGKGPWRHETDGSAAALEQLLGRKVDAAVLWEPDVSRALRTDGVIKLLSSADTQRLIVDVLVAGSGVIKQDPEMVRTLVTTYFQLLREYVDAPAKLEQAVAAGTRQPGEQVAAMLKGVAFATLSDNAETWMGTTQQANALFDTIRSSVRVLIDSGTVAADPLPDQDPYRILNRQFVGEAYTAATGAEVGRGPAPEVTKAFSPLDEAGWNRLREVATLKAFNVAFQSGTSDLSYEGKEELDRMMEILRHYPTFRVAVRGHTSTQGDAAANDTLSRDRADAVARYLTVTYGIDGHRMRVIGMGGGKPLPRSDGESDRAWQYRLPRVEVALLADPL